jgi:hypothetical protein
LERWGVQCRTAEHAETAVPRTLSEEEARTWIGLLPAKSKTGPENPPGVSGFAVEGPVILLGCPEDNAIIKFLLENKFLPYAPQKGVFPGEGRGMVAWQRDGVGHGQESVSLIAHDAEGLAEAIGTFYEAVAAEGVEPRRLADAGGLRRQIGLLAGRRGC